MWYIKNSEGRYYVGKCLATGCEVWKNHRTRATEYLSEERAHNIARMDMLVVYAVEQE